MYNVCVSVCAVSKFHVLSPIYTILKVSTMPIHSRNIV